VKIVVALFNIDTQALQYMSADQRVREVSNAVERARDYTSSQGTFWTDPSHLRAIFLAPEYCFARSLPNQKGDHRFGDQRQMDEDYVRNNLRPVFAKLSLGFKNALIVPGTVAWRKSIVPATDGKHGTPQQAAKYRIGKYTQRLQHSVDMSVNQEPDLRNTLDTTVFHNNFKRPDDPRASVNTFRDKIALLQKAHYIAKNTAHCYYNGDEVYKYNKIGDFYEIADPLSANAVNVPNRSTVSGTEVAAGRFSVAGLTFGISICYDQSLSVQDSSVEVKSTMPLQWTAGPVLFHILLSARIDPKAQAANLYDNGYLLSCSSWESLTTVLDARGSKAKRSTTVKTFPGNLKFYKVDV
jgi:hypothetical protein